MLDKTEQTQELDTKQDATKLTQQSEAKSIYTGSQSKKKKNKKKKTTKKQKKTKQKKTKQPLADPRSARPRITTIT